MAAFIVAFIAAVTSTAAAQQEANMCGHGGFIVITRLNSFHEYCRTQFKILASKIWTFVIYREIRHLNPNITNFSIKQISILYNEVSFLPQKKNWSNKSQLMLAPVAWYFSYTWVLMNAPFEMCTMHGWPAIKVQQCLFWLWLRGKGWTASSAPSRPSSKEGRDVGTPARCSVGIAHSTQQHSSVFGPYRHSKKSMVPLECTHRSEIKNGVLCLLLSLQQEI